MSTLLNYLFIALSASGVALLSLGLGKLLQRWWIKLRLMPSLNAGHADSTRKPVQHLEGNRHVPFWVEILSRLSLPESGLQDSATQLRFVRAGFRHANASRIYFAAKTALVLITLIMVFLLMPLLAPKSSWSHGLMVMLFLAIVANFLPDLYLHWRTRNRAQRMQDALPDIIDLLVICTESGLGLDSAIGKVAREMNRSCPELSEEFYLMGLEVRAGSARMLALRNLGTRVNLEDLYDLVSMLVQADRFGTSLAVSLRVQSEVMRGKRMQRAEEIAAKIPVKMLIPLVLFIFPVLLMVLLGPAVMQMEKIFGS